MARAGVGLVVCGEVAVVVRKRLTRHRRAQRSAMTKRKRPPDAPAVMDERALLGAIEKVKSRLASQKREIKRWKGDEAAAAGEQFLAHLEAKLQYLEADLEGLRAARPI